MENQVANNYIHNKKKDNLDLFLEEFASTESIFKKKNVLEHFYVPELIKHRDSHLKSIAEILAPCLRKEKPSNIFIYGKSGTGKTLCVEHVVNKIKTIAQSKQIEVKFISINCMLRNVADTEYRIILEILKQYKKEMPSTGISTNELYKELHKTIENSNMPLILVLDEIDMLIKKAGDLILYNLTRLNNEIKNSKITLIGITNDLTIRNNIDSRIKSSLNEEEINFLPYNANQITDILSERVKLAFCENVIEEGVIEKCAAFTAREDGDIRKALDLLKFSGELAQRENKNKISLDILDEGQRRKEKDTILEAIKSQPKQCQLVMYSIIKTSYKEQKNLITNLKTILIEPTTTGAVYDYYNKIGKTIGFNQLSTRRISDLIIELEVLGLINFKIISKGRYGRTRYIKIDFAKSLIKKMLKILKEELRIL